MKLLEKQADFAKNVSIFLCFFDFHKSLICKDFNEKNGPEQVQETGFNSVSKSYVSGLDTADSAIARQGEATTTRVI